MLEAGSAAAVTWKLVNHNSGTVQTSGTLDFTYGKQVRHFTTPATSGNWALYLYAGIAGSTTGVTVLFNKVKLEEGTMATAWSASPDDAKASVTELADSLEDLDAEMDDRIMALIDSLGLSEQFASASDFLDAVSQIELIRSDLAQTDSDMTLTFNRLQKTEDGLDTRYLETAGRVEAEFLERSRKKVCEQFSRLGLIMSEDAIDATVRPDVSQRIARYVRLALKRGIKNPGGSVVPNSTMDCLISACVKRIQENLRTIVITYNYDDLFECKLLDRLRIENIPHGDEIVRSASGMLPDATELICSGKNGPSVDIFYVHGRIPLFGGNPNNISDRIILSQQSYDILSRNHLEFANQVQYVVQSGIPIVSIGFSLDDINFCRLRTDLHSNYRHLPPFYSLQYCGSKDCVTCDPDVREKMDARLRHIEMLKIQALPMPSNDLVNCFNAIFN